MHDVARELGIPPETMAKTILLTISSQGLYRVVIPGMARLSMKKLAVVLALTRKDLQFASPELIEKAGFMVGAIPPFGGDIPTCIDASFLKQDVLYCGAGDHDKTFSLKPEDVIKLSQALVADITE